VILFVDMARRVLQAHHAADEAAEAAAAGLG
jgi:hypothetical protein